MERFGISEEKYTEGKSGKRMFSIKKKSLKEKSSKRRFRV